MSNPGASEASQPNSERVEVLMGLFDGQHKYMRDLTPAQLTAAMLKFLDSQPGQLFDQRFADEFTHLLAAWLIRDIGLTDQKFLELLFDSVGDYSNEYKPWAPNYDFPLTNREIADILSYETWDLLVDDIQEMDQASTHQGKRLAEQFYVAFGDDPEGALCWLERMGQSTEGDYPRFMFSDFESLKRNHRF